jgi:preprotein translocase subunit SecA
VVSAYVTGATAEGYVEDWDLDKLWTALKTLYPVNLDPKELTGETGVGEAGDLTKEELNEALLDDAHDEYEKREEQIDGLAGEGSMRNLERQVLLSVLDRKWREHLYEMDYLKEGIGLRAMAQRDPLVEYQREGFDMFAAMLEGLKEESVGFLFNLQVEVQQPQPEGVSVDAGLRSPVGAAPRPLPTQEAPVAANGVPAALRAKGIDDRGSRGFSYSGPDEGGHAEVHNDTEEYGDGDAGGATRRERREAARAESKGKRAPKTRRRH